MTPILVSGLINIETTLRVDGFPIEYFPVRYPFFGVNSSVSGVGFNIALALTTLGDTIHFLSLIGRDLAGDLVKNVLDATCLPADDVLDELKQTPQSVILYDPAGRRQIHVDLKDIQDQAYPYERFQQALGECSMAVLCNINFSRPFLRPTILAGKLIATDVHAISDLEDEYNRDFMVSANILFMSDEHLPCSPEDWVRRVWDRYPAQIVVVGMGAQGALLGIHSDHVLERIPAITTRPVVNTIGAGDAMFSAFIHFYCQSKDAMQALGKASLFASYKIGGTGAADGILDEASLNQRYASIFG
jgi:sugar/nucleoside kinase (ribokinase family)